MLVRVCDADEIYGAGCRGRAHNILMGTHLHRCLCARSRLGGLRGLLCRVAQRLAHVKSLRRLQLRLVSSLTNSYLDVRICYLQNFAKSDLGATLLGNDTLDFPEYMGQPPARKIEEKNQRALAR